MLYLAIDQHSKQLTVTDRNEAGDPTVKRQVSTKWDRVRAFLVEYRQRRAGRGFVAILEVCGFNDWLVKLLAEHGCRQVVLIQPEKRSRKTDRRDASALADLLWVNRERLLAGKPCKDRRVELPKRGGGRRPAGEPSCGSARGSSARGRSTRSSTFSASTTSSRSARPRASTRSRQRSGWGRRGAREDRPAGDGSAPGAVEAVGGADGEGGGRDPPASDAEQDGGRGGDDARLQAYSSLALASRIGSIERFPRPGSLASYWGLTPGCRNSGEATDRLGSITKQGSAMARFILGQLVLHVLRRTR